jgi:ubiquinone/menaquinone biosynthesis C-methylase UbiE
MHKVAEIYNANPEYEWDRLIRDPYHTLEFLVNMHHLQNNLPSDGLVLDAGGGPGRYTIELCRLGYDVVLLDISSGCIEFAEKKLREESTDVQERLREFVVGDVTNLSRFRNSMFDAVLCLDPLSCLPEEADRKKALAELVRVAKPDSVIAASVRGYLGALRTILRVAPHELVDGTLEAFRSSGNCMTGGAVCHFFRATEIKELAEDYGLETVLMAGCEGLSAGIPEATNAIAEDKAKWQHWVELVIETSTEPAIVDTSEHILYLGRKPKAITT